MSDVKFMTINETEQLVKEVVEDVFTAVTSTMGPNGQLGLIAVGTSTKVTKDGVTVAKAIKFNDPRKELVNKVMVEPAIKTDLECGDGTTTTIMMTAVLYKIFKTHPGYRNHKFIEEFVGKVIDKLAELSIKIDVDDPRLKQLALITSNGDEELSQVVTDIYASSNGSFPEIELKEGYENKDKVVPTHGLPIGMMFSNPGFSQYGNGAETTYESFYPVVVDEVIRAKDPEAIIKVLQSLHDKCDKSFPILIIARSIEHDYNAMFAQASGSPAPGGFKRFVGIQTNMGGSVGSLLMGDIASMFGVPMFSRIEDALDQKIPAVIGEDLVVSSTRSLLTDPSLETLERINYRVAEIEKELSGYDMGARFSVRAKFNEKRIRNLQGRLITIFVGGETASEVKERLDRFEDVIKAVKSGLIIGILPGVGTAMKKAALAVKLYPSDYLKNTSIVTDLIDGFSFQYRRLMCDVGIEDYEDRICFQVMNLATGEVGTAEELGIYDTAFASITALKGGLQTAKILANTKTLLLGDKLSAVKLQQ